MYKLDAQKRFPSAKVELVYGASQGFPSDSPPKFLELSFESKDEFDACCEKLEEDGYERDGVYIVVTGALDGWRDCEIKKYGTSELPRGVSSVSPNEIGQYR